jgi:signal transduction histidine kinase
MTFRYFHQNIKRYLFDFHQIKDDDLKRRALILNIILISIFLLSVAAGVCWTVVYFFYAHKRGINILFENLGTITFFGIGSFVLIKINQKNYTKISAIVLLSLLLIANFHTTFTYGCDIPQTILTYSLIIIMSGILISSKASLIFLSAISLYLVTLYELQAEKIINVSQNWKNIPVTIFDVVMFVIVYLVIALISWISNNEIERSISMYRNSEKEALKLAGLLKKHNEQLANMVEEKTKEIREHQLKQLMALNVWSEYGKISAGLLHDIKNPLTIISLNLGTLNEAIKKFPELEVNKCKELFRLIQDSNSACNNISTVIKSSQKQLLSQVEEPKALFDVNTEIKNVILLFDHKAARKRIKIDFNTRKKLKGFGDVSKFSRVIANLIMNSIDAFEGITKKEPKINITVSKKDGDIVIKVKDNGVGIKKSIQSKIFQPLYSTKHTPERAGIGLYISRDIIKNDFGGSLNFTSKYKLGSVFTIKIADQNNGK